VCVCDYVCICARLRSAAMSVRFFSEDMESFNDMERESGTVKWFDSARGFGFIVRDNGEDLFVHFSSVQADGYRSLEEGQRVEYSIGQGRKGQIACDVVVE
jgi:CspA family cold shock protein